MLKDRIQSWLYSETKLGNSSPHILLSIAASYGHRQLWLLDLPRHIGRCLLNIAVVIFLIFFKKWAIPGLFFFIFVFSIQLTVNVEYKFLPMTGFEPQTSGIGSDRSTNWATTTTLIYLISVIWLMVSHYECKHWCLAEKYVTIPNIVPNCLQYILAMRPQAVHGMLSSLEPIPIVLQNLQSEFIHCIRSLSSSYT